MIWIIVKGGGFHQPWFHAGDHGVDAVMIVLWFGELQLFHKDVDLSNLTWLVHTAMGFSMVFLWFFYHSLEGIQKTYTQDKDEKCMLEQPGGRCEGTPTGQGSSICTNRTPSSQKKMANSNSVAHYWKNKMKPTNPNADTYVDKQRQYLFVMCLANSLVKHPEFIHWGDTIAWRSYLTLL